MVLWVVLGAVLWNVVFDREIQRAANEYLALQASHERGLGPEVTIDEIMRRAAARGVRVASAWSFLATAGGLGVLMYVGARARRRT
jgi:hypothetical protein